MKTVVTFISGFTLRVLALALLAAAAQADEVTRWNKIALDTVVASGQHPGYTSRAMAMVQVAVFDALNSIEGRFTPYKVKAVAAQGTSEAATVAAAAHYVLVSMFANQKTALDDAYKISLESVRDGPGKTNGIALGEKVAEQIYTIRSADGVNTPDIYKPFTAPGVYVPTALPIGSTWPKFIPWMLKSPAQFRPEGPPALNSSLWARDFNEIKARGGRNSTARTPEQTEIGRFWSVTGPASYIPVAAQLVAATRLSSIDNARILALVAMTGADAHTAVYDAKYAYNFWRPITAIRNGEADGNDQTAPDAAWLPLIDTPMHPEYPCAHCIVSASVATVLESAFGAEETAQVTMTSSGAPGVKRSWTRLEDYANEIAMARIYAGVHYRNSTDVGQRMGRDIGAYAVQNYLKRP